MALLFYLILFNSQVAVIASILILIGHGYIRRGLFQTFKIIYQISHSRNIFFNKGVGGFIGIFYFLFFFVCCLNSSLPLNLRFFSEIVVGFSLFFLKKFIVIFFVFSVFLIGLFKMKLFLITCHGGSCASLKKKEPLLAYCFFSVYPIILNFFFVFFFKSFFF